MPIECKVSNSATNSIKRLNNDAAVKARIWRGEFGERQVVPSAVTWLKAWLTEEANRLRRLPALFIWVSSGATSLTRASPALRRLAEQGLRHEGRILRIPLR